MSSLILNTVLNLINFLKRKLELATYKIRIALPPSGWEPAVITTNWEPAEWDSPWWDPVIELLLSLKSLIYAHYMN